MNPTAMNLPYVLCISDNIPVPDGGLKSKAMIQAVLTILIRREEFKGDGKEGGGGVNCQCWEVTPVFESMLLLLREDVERPRTRKISEANGIEQVEYPTCMMTLNFLTQMQKLLRSCVVVAHAFMCRTQDSTQQW
jgi:hypothetical protein